MSVPMPAAYSPVKVGQSLRTNSSIYRLSDGEAERLCKKCGEWWPADSTFFQVKRDRNTLDSWCRDCRNGYDRQGYKRKVSAK